MNYLHGPIYTLPTFTFGVSCRFCRATYEYVVLQELEFCSQLIWCDYCKRDLT